MTASVSLSKQFLNLELIPSSQRQIDRDVTCNKSCNKLKQHCSVEPKDISGTIKIKTKLGNFLHLHVDS